MKCQHCDRVIDMSVGYCLMHISRHDSAPSDIYLCTHCAYLALGGLMEEAKE